MAPPFTLSTRLQSLLNLYKCIQLRYFLSANNTYCPSFSNFSLILCIFLVMAVHSEHGPPFTLSTHLQSVVNLYKYIQLPYFLSGNNIYYHSISNCFFDAVYLSHIYCIFSSCPSLTLHTRLKSLLNLH